tara:strand:- start:1404 stop:2573 length:1170 start_codon:yes stop_codon:yes gene_type:complete
MNYVDIKHHRAVCDKYGLDDNRTSIREYENTKLKDEYIKQKVDEISKLKDNYTKLIKQKDDKITKLIKQKDDEIAKHIKQKDDEITKLIKQKDDEITKLIKQKDDEFTKLIKQKDDEITKLKVASGTGISKSKKSIVSQNNIINEQSVCQMGEKETKTAKLTELFNNCTLSTNDNIQPEDGDTFTDEEFFSHLTNDTVELIEKINFLNHEYGTTLPCNRFPVGNAYERFVVDHLKCKGFEVEGLPNAPRFDMNVINYKHLSIKYSSSGAIKLHNSNNSSNKDIKMVDTLLITPSTPAGRIQGCIFLLSLAKFDELDIDHKPYLKDTKDGLQLDRSFLTYLKKKKYPFIFQNDIKHIKKSCNNTNTSQKFIEDTFMPAFHNYIHNENIEI